jgi:hypothetical protein
VEEERHREIPGCRANVPEGDSPDSDKSAYVSVLAQRGKTYLLLVTLLLLAVVLLLLAVAAAAATLLVVVILRGHIDVSK